MVDDVTRDVMLFPDQLREATSANKDLNRQVQELTTIRMQLEGERDGLAAELSDTRDALRDAQMRLDAANNALSALRSEMEARLREKDDELENLRYAPSFSCYSDQRLTSSIHSQHSAKQSRHSVLPPSPAPTPRHQSQAVASRSAPQRCCISSWRRSPLQTTLTPECQHQQQNSSP